jgi:hypothetical protein
MLSTTHHSSNICRREGCMKYEVLFLEAGDQQNRSSRSGGCWSSKTSRFLFSPSKTRLEFLCQYRSMHEAGENVPEYEVLVNCDRSTAMSCTIWTISWAARRRLTDAYVVDHHVTGSVGDILWPYIYRHWSIWAYSAEYLPRQLLSFRKMFGRLWWQLLVCCWPLVDGFR